jgi:hypothetical protein
MPTAHVSYDLYTHCGVREARVGSTYYATEHVLDDGHGNPPPGWSDQQAGTMTLMSDGTAVFSDPRGHHVVFYPRPAATGFATICS